MEEEEGEGHSLLEPKEDIYQIIQELVRDDVLFNRIMITCRIVTQRASSPPPRPRQLLPRQLVTSLVYV